MLLVAFEGVDALRWKQAQLDNPDPKRLVPVVVNGFEALVRHAAKQSDMIKQHDEAKRVRSASLEQTCHST